MTPHSVRGTGRLDRRVLSSGDDFSVGLFAPNTVGKRRAKFMPCRALAHRLTAPSSDGRMRPDERDLSSCSADRPARPPDYPTSTHYRAFRAGCPEVIHVRQIPHTEALVCRWYHVAAEALVGRLLGEVVKGQSVCAVRPDGQLKDGCWSADGGYHGSLCQVHGDRRRLITRVSTR